MDARDRERGVIIIAILFVITVAMLAYVVVNSLKASSQSDDQAALPSQQMAN